jgi:Transglutaminase-like superfamily
MTSFFNRSRSGFSPLVTMLVAGAWIVLMGTLLYNKYMPSDTGPGKGLQFAIKKSDDWFLLRVGGAYAGFGRSRQFRRNGEWIIRDDLNLSLNLQGFVKPIKVSNESRVDDRFRMISFHMKVSSGIISFEQKGHMEGKDLVLEIPRSQGGGTKRLRLHEVPRISRALGLPVPLTGLHVGQEIHIPVFDPLEGGKSDAVIHVLEKAKIEISGKKVPAWSVNADYRAADLTMWIDDDGRLLKGRMPLNITVTRSDRAEIDREMKTRRDLPDLVSIASVPLDGTIPENADIKLLRLKVEGSKDFAIPSDGYRQEFKNGVITVTKEHAPQAAYRLPCKSPNMEQYLASSRFIRSDQPEIVKTARKIVGTEKDPVKAAALINNWVFHYLKKTPTATIPDALTVLRSRQGACNEHAVLAAALARAVGIPARIAVGLIPIDGDFYYHAWVSYWSGETWFTGDPLRNKMPVGPTYVTLLYGDVDKHVNVISFLGRLKLKVLEVK